MNPMRKPAQIHRAAPEDATTLTDIAFAAKRHWGYPERWIEKWRDVLTICPEFVARHVVFMAGAGGKPVGFYSLVCRLNRVCLEHLWVLPEWMGQGVGRALFLHSAGRAGALGFRKLEIESDPNASGFYERMGARRVGATLTELDGQARELPNFEYALFPKPAPGSL